MITFVGVNRKKMMRFKTCIVACLVGLASVSISAQSDKTFRHTIEAGETVYAIATMYGVSTEAIYKLNPGSREGIRAGEVLLVPQEKASFREGAETETYTFHTIEPKETLYAVSMKYKVPAQHIVEANPGLSTKTFRAGRTIRIPVEVDNDLKGQASSAAPVEAEKKEITYEVQRKETMYSLCRKFKVSSYELIRLNPALKKGVKAGMVIRIPVSPAASSPASSSSSSSSEMVIESETAVNALLDAPKSVERLDGLKVALLLPFNPNQGGAASSRFIEYYEGMLLAIDSLRSQGYSLDLSVFNTGNGTKHIEEILTGPTLPNVNLIIGAVQNDQIKLIADFAKEHDIKYVIPFTSKNDDVLSNACVFQVNTPHSYLYSKAAERGRKLFANDNIIFVNTPDKEEKKEFIQTFKAELKEHNVPYKEMGYNRETFAEDIDSLYMEDGRRNVVIPTSSSFEALQQIKTPLRMLAETQTDYTVAMFGYPEWQTYVRDALEDFYVLDTYIYSNFYADNLGQPMHDFYDKFKTWYSKDLINTYPKYGILGFDTGMFFFGAMNRYGANFEERLDDIRYQPIQTGFDFHRVNNWGGFINTNIFIVHYQKDYTVTRE